MSLAENGGLSAADVAAVTGNNGFGGFGGDGAWWLLVLFLFAFNGNGWGGNGGFGGGYNSIYPWMNQANITSEGFQNQMLNDNITSIRDGVNNLSTQLCNTGSDIQMALCNGFAGVEQGANARQMANMQSIFGVQTALQNCCCENRASIADLKYTVGQEGCADRAALSNSTRDIIESQTRSTQAILDKLCQQEIDQKNETIANLRTQVNMMNLAASQNQQTSQLMQDNAQQTANLLQRLNPNPIPSYIVQNPNGCNCNTFNGCCA